MSSVARPQRLSALLTVVAFKLSKQPSQSLVFQGEALERLDGAKIALIGEDRSELWSSEAMISTE